MCQVKRPSVKIQPTTEQYRCGLNDCFEYSTPRVACAPKKRNAINIYLPEFNFIYPTRIVIRASYAVHTV